jgi:hypothetical protein
MTPTKELVNIRYKKKSAGANAGILFYLCVNLFTAAINSWAHLG